MLALFLPLFIASITLVIIFLLTLPGDLKKESLRPIFILLMAIAFWGGTLAGFVAPEIASTTTYPPANILSGNVVVAYPLEVTTFTPGTLPIVTYNDFFYIWLTILFFLFFLGIFWYVLLVRRKAMLLMHEGKDALGKLEDRFD